jgi:hypothetical protein
MLSWSLLWPCSLSQMHWGSSPSLLSCCEIRLAVMCDFRLYDHSLSINLAVQA